MQDQTEIFLYCQIPMHNIILWHKTDKFLIRVDGISHSINKNNSCPFAARSFSCQSIKKCCFSSSRWTHDSRNAARHDFSSDTPQKMFMDFGLTIGRVKIADTYEKRGAACLSVLTDEKYFQCPFLCKEFIVDAWKIYYARTKGADAILLIAAVLPDLDIQYMTKICKTLGLAALVEVHDEKEMDRVLGIEGIQLVGINNRNLGTFEVDISNARHLLEGGRGEVIRQKDIIVVGESGLFTPSDIAYVQDVGVKAHNSNVDICFASVGWGVNCEKNYLGKGISGIFGKDISP
ncbi:hypothetical protein MKW98_006746 [Papaver atlanticum]|uniref:indole-3-glycerol-phosphate synthase n=1 Tax=Papaver atlanticum TaxID=357466 RepID=A0AAD4XMJ6_9MAGN|nr:hypothetical protein MKW98_006746 [Papaver atlanticum]